MAYKMWHKIVSVVLVFALLLTMAPVYAYANDSDTLGEQQVPEQGDYNYIRLDSLVQSGRTITTAYYEKNELYRFSSYIVGGKGENSVIDFAMPYDGKMTVEIYNGDDFGNLSVILKEPVTVLVALSEKYLEFTEDQHPLGYLAGYLYEGGGSGSVTEIEDALKSQTDLYKMKKFDGFSMEGTPIDAPGIAPGSALALSTYDLYEDDAANAVSTEATTESSSETEAEETIPTTEAVEETEPAEGESVEETTEVTSPAVDTTAAADTSDISENASDAETEAIAESVTDETEGAATIEQLAETVETEAPAEDATEAPTEAATEAPTEAVTANIEAEQESTEDVGTFTVNRSVDTDNYLPYTHNFIRWEGRYVEYNEAVDGFSAGGDAGGDTGGDTGSEEEDEWEPISEGDTQVLAPGYYVFVFKYESEDNTYENDVLLREHARFLVVKVMEGDPAYPEAAAATEDGYTCVILDPGCGYTTMVRQLAGDPVELVSGSLNWNYTDLEIDGDEPLAFTRTYHSLEATNDCGMGYGWAYSFNYYL